MMKQYSHNLRSIGVRSILGASLAVVLLGQARADICTFTYTDGLGNTAFGTLTATDNGNGTHTATSGTMTVTGGLAAGGYSLLPGAGISPSGWYTHDSLLYVPASPAYLDVDGLLFVDGTGREVNIWGNGTNPYSFWASDPANGIRDYVHADQVGDFHLECVPEPGSFAALGLGAAAMVARRRRRAKA